MGARPSSFCFTSDGPLRIYSTKELLEMPLPTWLIEPIMPVGGFVGLYGQPACGKSFLAIDIAMSIATGTPWQGRPTEKGLVLYIGAEGGSGIGKRVHAWLASKGLAAKDANIGWLLESLPVHANSEGLEALFTRITEEIRRTPVLIVVDTLARCFDGDENQQEDMGRFISGIDLLRKEYGCTVLIVHHTRLDGVRERGNTAFRGAADTMIGVVNDSGVITVTCDKQKDDEEFAPLTFELHKVDGTASCVLGGAKADLAAKAKEASKSATCVLMLQMLEALQPCVWDDWRKATGLSVEQFGSGFQHLQQANRLGKTSHGWVVVNA